MAGVFVTVGTDHHPFDRVVAWVDRWAAVHPDRPVFVQYGTSRPPAIAQGAESLDGTELARRLAEADVVVCHGGPSTIMEVRDRGLLPVVVPRDPERGEHVDGHQQAFAREMAAIGRVRLVIDEADLASVLDAALADPTVLALSGHDVGDVEATVARVAELVDDLLTRRPARHRRAHR